MDRGHIYRLHGSTALRRLFPQSVEDLLTITNTKSCVSLLETTAVHSHSPCLSGTKTVYLQPVNSTGMPKAGTTNDIKPSKGNDPWQTRHTVSSQRSVELLTTVYTEQWLTVSRRSWYARSSPTPFVPAQPSTLYEDLSARSMPTVAIVQPESQRNL